MDIVGRILGGEQVCMSEILLLNAQKLMAWVRDTDRHHKPEGCKVKNCAHAPGRMTVEYAAALTGEAMHACTCGSHGASDPDEAARIKREFLNKWDPH